jgi:hypothetical protein
MLSRCKSYNPVSLVQEIMTSLEEYLVERILAHANGRFDKHKGLLRKLCGNLSIDPEKILAKDGGMYLVPSEKIPGT